MHAVVSYRGLPVDDERSLVEAEIPVPELLPHDLLVRVAAVSVNPVDVKRRAGLPESAAPTVLGYDAAGVVEAVGPAVTGYAAGDEVFYAGDITRPGSNAEYQAVDERIVGHKPKRLSWAEAAAMPLTTITAWETLFERFRLTETSEGTLLVLPGAGGVGSILIQLAKRRTRLTVIATASRGESRDFALSMGADHVVDHHGDLAGAALAIAPDGTDYIFSAHSASTVPAFVAMAKPFSEITAIDDATDVDLQLLKPKSLTWHWELMFTRSIFGTPDLAEQGILLDLAAALLNDGTLRTTLTTTLEGFTAASLKQAHRLVESGRMVGKVVVVR
jgi:zinc-binding alcohol dehydrogenase family protein